MYTIQWTWPRVVQFSSSFTNSGPFVSGFKSSICPYLSMNVPRLEILVQPGHDVIFLAVHRLLLGHLNAWHRLIDMLYRFQSERGVDYPDVQPLRLDAFQHRALHARLLYGKRHALRQQRKYFVHQKLPPVNVFHGHSDQRIAAVLQLYLTGHRQPANPPRQIQLVCPIGFIQLPQG